MLFLLLLFLILPAEACAILVETFPPNCAGTGDVTKLNIGLNQLNGASEHVIKDSEDSDKL